VKRFLKTFAFLMVSLFLLLSGVDAALDHLSQSPAQSSFIAYNEHGMVIMAYDGDLNACKVCLKPAPGLTPGLTPGVLHRT